MELTFVGENAEHLLSPPKPRRMLRKYRKDNIHYTVIGDFEEIHRSYLSYKEDDFGNKKSFIFREEITKEEFDNE